MKFQLFLALLPALTVLAAPIASLAEKPDGQLIHALIIAFPISVSLLINAAVPDAATVFIAVAGKRDGPSNSVSIQRPSLPSMYICANS